MTHTPVVVDRADNPFPRALAVNLEGRSYEPQTSGLLRTFARDPFRQSLAELNAYLDMYVAEPRGEGQALCVSGDHGSGKTHLIAFLKDTAISRAQAAYSAMSAATVQDAPTIESAAQSSRVPRLVQANVELDSPDFVALYRGIMQWFDYDLLREIIIGCLTGLAIAEAGQSNLTRTAAESLATGRGDVFAYLAEGFLSPSRVEGALWSMVADVTERDRDLCKAMSYLTDQRLGPEAARWLQGYAVEASVARSLGVDNDIDAPRARAALRLLVTLFGRARRPLLIYIDQVERLVRGADQATVDASVAALRSLAASFTREQGFLVLAGAPDGWQEFPNDFFGRVRSIVLPKLELEEALNLVKVYLTADATFSPYQSPGDISPFSVDAVREMVAIGRGNVRNVLRLAYQSYDEWPPTQTTIEISDVQHAARTLNEYFDRASVLAEVQVLLRQARIGYALVQETRTEGSLASSGVDLAIPETGPATALIHITGAVFRVDEAEQALRFVKQAGELRKLQPDARMVLIVTGYASQEVQQQLSGFANNYLIFNPRSFADDFKPILDAIKLDLQQPTHASVDADEQLQQQLIDLRSQLENALRERQQESQARDAQLQSLLEYQRGLEQQRQTEELVRLRRDLEEGERQREIRARAERDVAEREERERRRALGEEKRAQEARAQQLKRVEALRRAHADSVSKLRATLELERGVADRRQRLIVPLFAGGVFVLLLISAAWPYVSLADFNTVSTFAIVATSITTVVIVAVVFGALVYFRLLAPGARRVRDLEYRLQEAVTAQSEIGTSFQELDDTGEHDLVRQARASVSSLRPLDEIAHRIRRADNTSISVNGLMQDFNPQVRYVGARVMAARADPDLDYLVEQLTIDDWLPVQRVLLDTIIATLRDASLSRAEQMRVALLERLTEVGDAEAVCTMDAVTQVQPWRHLDLGSVLDRRPTFVLVDAIYAELFDGTGPAGDQSLSEAERLAIRFARSLRQYTSDEGASSPRWVQHADILAKMFRESRHSREITTESIANEKLGDLRPATLQEVAELFGLSGPSSLGYYEGLRYADVYGHVYQFLFETRVALQEYQYAHRI